MLVIPIEISHWLGLAIHNGALLKDALVLHDLFHQS